MKKLHFILLMIISSCFCLPELNASVNFTKKLEAARVRAAEEGKLFFIHFTARWCMPCQWMEQNTFQDKNLSDYANTHYVAVKVDIDERAGTFYQEHYQVTILPSLLLFNSQGSLLKRLEETIPAEKLLEILKNYNNTNNHRPKKEKIPVLVLESPRPRIHVSRPALIPEAATASYTSTKLIIPERVPENGSIPLPPLNVRPVPAANVAFTNRAIFSIQVGVYTDYSNAIRQVRKLERRIKETVQIQETKQDKRKKYKILIGDFQSREKAVDYLELLKSNNIWGFIKKRFFH